MKNLAVIPARSGSKGVKDKNIRLLNGKPLMAYSIEAAMESGVFSEVMVSTDSEEYAGIAVSYGAAVPFLRSDETSGDLASSWDMVEEVLEKYKEKNMMYDSFCLLQPTSPLRTAKSIRSAYELFVNNAANAVVSVCEAEHSPLWCGHLPENREFIDFIDPESIKQRQAGGKFYRLNGAIYIVDTEYFKKNKFLYQKGSYAYIMDQKESIDIDTYLDFAMAEFFLTGTGYE